MAMNMGKRIGARGLVWQGSLRWALWTGAVCSGMCQGEGSVRPIHFAEKTHYSQYKGEETVLVTSGEHYGAVLNGAFRFEHHYAEPAAALENYDLDRVLADDEAGFDGSGNAPYRIESCQIHVGRLNTKSGDIMEQTRWVHGGGVARLKAPDYERNVAVRIEHAERE